MLRPPSLALVALGLALFAGAFVTLAPRGEPRFGGAFALTDTRGRGVTDASLRGEPFALFFGFTRCPGMCPRTLGRLAQLERALESDGPGLKVVFVSVDPQDSAAALEQYLSGFRFPILGLTGDAEARARMLRTYRAFTSGAGANLSHTGTVFLVTSRGDPAGTLEPTETDATWLSRVRALRRDQP
jgi:protein SCO1/2